MQITQYDFDIVATSLYEMDVDAAKSLLPKHLQPLERIHGIGIFSLTAFHFTNSEVGSYDEVVLSVLTPPAVTPDGKWPQSAFCPFLVGTSTEESRLHAIKKWHLPHYMRDIAVDFKINDDKVKIRVREDDEEIITATSSVSRWQSVDHLYQLFTTDASNSYKVDIRMIGQFSEHEEATGEIIFHPHAMSDKLLESDIACYPFREMVMLNGVQRFNELDTL